MKRLVTFIILNLLMSVVVGQIHAAETDEEHVPKFAVLDWFPYGWREDENLRGMFVDIADAINKQLVLRSEIVIAPVPRVLRGMATGEFDVTLTYRAPQVVEGVKYLFDLGCLNSVVVSLKDRPVKRFEDMRSMRIAYPSGGYFDKRFAAKLKHDDVKVAQNYVMFRMALRKRLDAFVISDAVWQGYRQDLYPEFKIPKDRWKDFAEPYYLEALPLALSVSENTVYQGIAQQLSSLMDMPSFEKKLRNIYSKYALPTAMNCLN